MPKNTTINLRVDSEVKEQAGEILASLGMTLSEAFNLLLHQVRIVRGLPFEIKQGPPPFPPGSANNGYASATPDAALDDATHKPWARKEATMDKELIKLVAAIMKRKPEDIGNINVLDKGMTNRTFTFTCEGTKYILRVPGEGTDELINRYEEYVSYQKVIPFGICDDVVHIDPETGYKITVFWENARVCDPFNFEDVALCMKALRNFHELKLEVPHAFDIPERTSFYESLLSSPSCFYDHAETKENTKEMAQWVESLGTPKSFTHIDAVPDNFLLLPGAVNEEVRLLDWEYAGMADPHTDIAFFAIYAMYEREHVEKLIDCYFPEGCEPVVRRKIYAYIAMCGLLWSNWCEYKRQLGVEFGEYALKQYYYAKEYYQIWKSGK